MEAGVATRALRKRKTSQNDHSHGSFFLRIGAIGKKEKKKEKLHKKMEIYLLSIVRFSLLILSIAMRCCSLAFGLGTMIYNGLEFGAFFEVPPTSPCYQILQGVNPVLQMIFTFMQMYFIFMNSRVSKDKDCELCICSIF